MTHIQLDNEHWNCECKNNYIKHVSIRKCDECKAQQEDQPDSRADEVAKLKEVLREKPYTNHPDDTHLSIRLVKFQEQFVTFLHNETMGYCEGKYFGNNLKKALKNFNNRGYLIDT